ncbi:MAG: T9SS type A sorting domain-containing protein, partial [Ignavibacteriaceae bacterium]|nr:T9SS type A sorting domain-containing protein [Ignavibacteriaceae bacterium]
PITVDTWYRLVVAVDLGTSFKSYLNGTLLLAHASQLVDDRWSLAPHLFLFGDDDGDDGLIQVAEVAIWDYALSEIEIAALGGPGTALPVELTSFTASASNDIITLNWETASEVNNSGFSIERKGQAAEWKSIGFVPGYGTSAEKHNYSFNDKLNASGKYFYRLKQIDQNGQYNYSKEVEVVVTPSEFKLYNNYPNPFNPSTTISYNLSADAVVSLRVYNSVGELVTELFNGTQSAGFYEVQFHSNMNNINLASGIYLVELRANQNVQRIKMILNK